MGLLDISNISISNLKSIGSETEKKLKELDIYTIYDLLQTFPSRYEDYSVNSLEELVHNEKATLVGEIVSIPILSYFARNKNRLTFKISVGEVIIQVILFNQGFYKGKLELNDTVTISGKWDKYKLSITGQLVKKGVKEDTEALDPIYPLKGVIPNYQFKKLVSKALEQFDDNLLEILPDNLLTQYKIPSIKDTYISIHKPANRELLKHARRRITYEELLLFQLKIQALKQINRLNENGTRIPIDYEEIRNFIATNIPFSLTNAQNKVLNEIFVDLKATFPMNRLLQGDVGSGKTVVAAIALFAAVSADFQGALMVPTEILAEQHFDTLNKIFRNTNINVKLLTSTIKGKARESIYNEVEGNIINIIIGTHALLNEKLRFKNLGLVITDEQHRFGVEQRKVLREKGSDPNVLFMTATPIPRTLSITAFGEMDVSIIDELPKGRKRIETYTINKKEFVKVLEFLQAEISKGRQAYFICPLIEESEKLDLNNAYDLYEQLSIHYSGIAEIGLMHGRLNEKEKEEVMQKFINNKIQILVSTTVVEVGVNVPNATLMIINDAERFGLAQLHQLRGRVGRGEDQSYCVLVADPKTDMGRERLKIMTETNNGFEIAEKDLQIRGPGDFFGAKQSGLPEFKIADLVHDYRALEVARQDAEKFINDAEFWTSKKYKGLKDHLDKEIILNRVILD
ncbi:MAG: recG [Bacillales bacterium]|nr:recG [Bacillales bacterium]